MALKVKVKAKKRSAAARARLAKQKAEVDRLRQSLGFPDAPQRNRRELPVEVRSAALASDEEIAADRLVQQADPADVKRLCEQYGLRREDLGRMTGFSLRALADWSTGKLPSEPAKRRLHEIRRLLDSLAEVVKPEAIPAWMKARNPAFDNMTPIQVIEVGEIDRLWQMVYAMGSDSLA